MKRMAVPAETLGRRRKRDSSGYFPVGRFTIDEKKKRAAFRPGPTEWKIRKPLAWTLGQDITRHQQNRKKGHAAGKKEKAKGIRWVGFLPWGETGKWWGAKFVDLGVGHPERKRNVSRCGEPEYCEEKIKGIWKRLTRE